MNGIVVILNLFAETKHIMGPGDGNDSAYFGSN
jgi:hypothetical protein